ncbi:hypothetical protein ASE74_23125 [Pedobacter sp. Leaf216]|uniref:FEKKY domain-containing protein n=1 Tax=Pedobacter sp. Leaf216 TaxID=1735684 RepID=UPI0006F980E0|nr:hypothetical protein [Pedobacter sp. Leaf216]KQM72498.1 hypothetical protein ASE74_23125 [Pedobacter sp. Leaf216]
MEKSYLILLFVCFIKLNLSAQVVKPIDSAEIHSTKLAHADLKNGCVKFLIRGGIISSYTKGQEVFEKKYGIAYYSYGCVMPVNISINDYNKVVASFMDLKYGTDWRKEVRSDIQGI